MVAIFFSPLTYLILLMMVFQGIWYTIGRYDFVVSDEAYMNGPVIFYQCLAAGGILFIIAMVTGTTLH